MADIRGVKGTEEETRGVSSTGPREEGDREGQEQKTHRVNVRTPE